MTATIGGTKWDTSIFPSAESYALPLKRAVLNAEDIAQGDEIDVELDVHDG